MFVRNTGGRGVRLKELKFISRNLIKIIFFMLVVLGIGINLIF